MNVLIINAGSSSLKYQLMNPETGEVSAKGQCVIKMELYTMENCPFK